MDPAPTVWVAAAFIAVRSAGSLGRQARLFRSWVVARASPLSPMLPHATSPQLLDAERQHGRSVGAGDRALSASSTPRRLTGEQCATPRERLPSGREAAAAWLLCVFIAALALGATSGLHNNEQPARPLWPTKPRPHGDRRLFARHPYRVWRLVLRFLNLGK
jgi:hypothetical protein